MRRHIVTLALVAALCVGSQISAGKKGGGGGGGGDSASYTVVKLAPPGAGVTESWARDLDSSGNVVGYYVDGLNRRHGFYYDVTLETYLVFAPGVALYGLSDPGEMVGTDHNLGVALYWRSPTDANPVELAPLAGDTVSRAYKINDSGFVIGSSAGDGTFFPVAWKIRANGTASAPIVLPFAGNDTRGDVANLNEADEFGVTQIVGYSGVDDLYETAVRWEVVVDDNDDPFILSGPTDLGSLLGYGSAAFDINFYGDVVGQSGREAFRKIAGQSMYTLPMIQKATSGAADGINDTGQIVGRQEYLFKGYAVQVAVLWPNATSVVDLNKEVSLGRSEELLAAFAINNSGHILAVGYFPSVSEGDVGCVLVPNEP